MIVMMVMVAALVVVIIVMRSMLRHDGRQHVLGEAVVVLHRGEDLRAGQLIPRRGDDAGLVVVLAQQVDGGLQLLLAHLLGAGEQDGARVLDLVEEELAEVLDVHAALHRVRDGHEAAHPCFGDVLLHALHGADDVRELAHAGRLDEDAVGVILVDDLLEGLAEVSHQRAADAAGVHLRHLDAGLLHEAAVDADLAELVFNQDDLLAGEGFLQQLLDERGLARAEEAGKNINLGHGSHLLMGFKPKQTKISRNTGFRLITLIVAGLHPHPCAGKTSFLARPLGTLQMIAEAACSRSSRRTCRRCGLHLKGLRPLQSSPELTCRVNQPETWIPTDYCTPFSYEIQGFAGKSQFQAVRAVWESARGLQVIPVRYRFAP